MRHVTTLGIVVALALVFMSSSASAGTIDYLIQVNSSTFSGPGFIEFQFLPGGPSSAPATAYVHGFASTSGTTLGIVPTIDPFFAPNPSGGVSPPPYTLPVTLDNSTFFNAVAYDINYGNSFEFQVELSGPMVGSTEAEPSNFAVFLYGPGPTLLPGGDPPLGEHFRICTGPGCDAFSALFGSIQQIPEPSTWALLGVGLAGLGVLRWRKRRSRA